jgi:hypothetical protein
MAERSPEDQEDLLGKDLHDSVRYAVNSVIDE